eukprot:COSAG01_NODE_28857_length_651_cov_0.882246_2_plen_38_part_01
MQCPKPADMHDGACEPVQQPSEIIAAACCGAQDFPTGS